MAAPFFVRIESYCHILDEKVMSHPKKKILILCTGNSCRSQMAEGYLKRELATLAEVYSAGSHPASAVHPLAIAVMAEDGVDISRNSPKKLDQFLKEGIHTVITVCGDAEEACPLFPGHIHQYHWGFEDPAKMTGSDDEVLAGFRRVRSEIERVFCAYAAGLKESL